MSALRRRAPQPASYPAPRIYGAILALRRGGERVENYCRHRRLHVIGNAILDEDSLLARAAEAGYSRPSRSSTSRLAHMPEVKPLRA